MIKKKDVFPGVVAGGELLVALLLPLRLALVVQHEHLLRPLPQPQRLVVARGRHEPAVRAHRQAPDLAVVAVEGEDALEAVRVPLLDLAVLGEEVKL